MCYFGETERIVEDATLWGGGGEWNFVNVKANGTHSYRKWSGVRCSGL
jgi:hypothetical protein